jgi:hypothetical protein
MTRGGAGGQNYCAVLQRDAVRNTGTSAVSVAPENEQWPTCWTLTPDDGGIDSLRSVGINPIIARLIS